MGKKAKDGGSSWWKRCWSYVSDDAIRIAMVLLTILQEFRAGRGSKGKDEEGSAR